MADMERGSREVYVQPSQTQQFTLSQASCDGKDIQRLKAIALSGLEESDHLLRGECLHGWPRRPRARHRVASVPWDHAPTNGLSKSPMQDAKRHLPKSRRSPVPFHGTEQSLNVRG